MSSRAVLLWMSAIPCKRHREFPIAPPLRRTHLEVRNKLFHDRLPRNESLDEDIGGAEVVRRDVLLDQRLVS